MHLSTSGSHLVKAHSPAVLLLDEGVKDGSASTAFSPSNLTSRGATNTFG